MATKIYELTAKAGAYIAGIKRLPGQTEIELTAEQAAYELAQETIIDTGEEGGAPAPEPAPVLAADRVELKRSGLATRPTAANSLASPSSAAGRSTATPPTPALAAGDKGALVIVTNASARVVTLANDWAEG